MNNTSKRIRPTVAEREQALVEALKNGVVAFSYKKKDGQLRRAIGTKNAMFIPAEFRPKGNGDDKGAKTTITYFDMQKQSWRSIATHKALSVLVK